MQEIYNLKKDTKKIKLIQKASLDKQSKGGLKTEGSLLFGTKEWFDAIETGIIEKHIVQGVISNIFTSGHNDYPEFEIKSNSGKSVWSIEGVETAYKKGNNVELIFVNQKYKRPSDITGTIFKCVIQISIGVPARRSL